jgi:small subunit ribosomal protein S6
MALYDTFYIIKNEISSKQVNILAEQIDSYLKPLNGKILKKEYWGIRDLAYLIKKQKKGHYLMLGLECDAQNISKLEQKIKSHEEILKHLFLKTDKMLKEDSLLTEKKTEAVTPKAGDKKTSAQEAKTTK